MEWTVGNSLYNSSKAKGLEDELGSPQRPKEAPRRPCSHQNRPTAPCDGPGIQHDKQKAAGNWLFQPLFTEHQETSSSAYFATKGSQESAKSQHDKSGSDHIKCSAVKQLPATSTASKASSSSSFTSHEVPAAFSAQPFYFASAGANTAGTFAAAPCMTAVGLGAPQLDAVVARNKEGAVKPNPSRGGVDESIWAAGKLLHTLRSELAEASLERERAEERVRAAEQSARLRSAETKAEVAKAVAKAEAATQDLVELREASWYAREESARLGDRLAAAEAEAAHLSEELVAACTERDTAVGLLETLSVEAASGRNALATSEEERLVAQEEADELRGRVEALDKSCSDLGASQEELEAARKEVAALREANSMLHAKISQQETASTEAARSLAELESLQSQLEARASDLEQNLVLAAEERTRREVELEEARNQAQVAEARACAAAESARQRVEELEEKRLQAEAQDSELQAACKEFEASQARVAELEASVRVLEASVERFREASEAAAVRAMELEMENSELTAWAAGLEQQLGSAKSLSQESTRQIEELAMEKALLQDRLEAAETAAEAAIQEAQGFKEEAQTSVDKSRRLEDAMQQLTNRLATLQTAADEAAAEHHAVVLGLEERLEVLKGGLDNAGEDKQALQRLLCAVKQELKAATQNLEAAEASADRAKKESNISANVVMAIKEQRDAADMRAKELQCEAVAAVTERDRCLAETDELRAQLDSALTVAREEIRQAKEEASKSAIVNAHIAEREGAQAQAAREAQTALVEERTERQAASRLLKEAREELDGTLKELLVARGASSSLKAQLEESNRELEAALECQNVLQGEINALSEAAAEDRANAGQKIETLEAERDKAEAQHTKELRRVRMEASDEREKSRLVAQQMSSFVAGLKEELECIREDREDIRAGHESLQHALAESEVRENALRVEYEILQQEKVALEERASTAETSSAAATTVLEQMNAKGHAEHAERPVSAAAQMCHVTCGNGSDRDVIWKTNSLPESQPVNDDVAGQLVHAAAGITSFLSSELGSLRTTSGAEDGQAGKSPARVVPDEAAHHRASLKTPPTPNFGPGWVEQQKQKFEGISAAPLITDRAAGEDNQMRLEDGVLDTSAEAHLDRLTLLLWQLQSGEQALQAREDAMSTEEGSQNEPRMLLDAAVSEAERLVQERSQAKAEAARLSAKVEGLEREQQAAAVRMQEAGSMWSQASSLAQRTVEELSAAADRIAWLEEELAATRKTAAAVPKPTPCANLSANVQHRRGSASPSGTFVYGSVGSQMAALRQVHERLTASEAMEDPIEASALLRVITSELASLVQSVAVSSSAIPAHPLPKGCSNGLGDDRSTPNLSAKQPARRSADFAHETLRRYRFSSASPTAEAARPRTATPPGTYAGQAGVPSRHLHTERNYAPRDAKTKSSEHSGVSKKAPVQWRF